MINDLLFFIQRELNTIKFWYENCPWLLVIQFLVLYFVWTRLGLKHVPYIIYRVLRMIWNFFINAFYFFQGVQIRRKNGVYIASLEKKISEYFSADVRLEKVKDGKGRLRVQYSDYDELNKFLKILGWESDENEQK